MRKIVYWALACVLYLTGCESSSSEEVIPQTTFVPVQFSVQVEKEIISFPATRSMPDSPIPEPTASKAGENDTELNDLCSTIEYVVFKNEETPAFVKHKQFTYNPTDLDADFSCIYDSLPQGDYRFYFLAHNSKTAELSGSTFSFDSISDTFYETLSLNIGVAETVNEDITLQRIVSRIEFMATDPVSGQLKQFDMEIDGRSDRLDLFTGQGIKNPDKQMFSHTFTEDEIGDVNKIHAFYTFIPATDNQITARLSAITKNDELIRERQIKDITPERNKIIRYKGRLYSRSESDDTFQISIYNNGEWEETSDVDLPEYE
ncbi:MAG: hypothetical protein J6K31_12460 [Parabacteroides sp.]|nr:hypothetical protein [Parabacteroides sp.]